MNFDSPKIRIFALALASWAPALAACGHDGGHDIGGPLEVVSGGSHADLTAGALAHISPPSRLNEFPRRPGEPFVDLSASTGSIAAVGFLFSSQADRVAQIDHDVALATEMRVPLHTREGGPTPQLCGGTRILPGVVLTSAACARRQQRIFASRNHALFAAGLVDYNVVGRQVREQAQAKAVAIAPENDVGLVFIDDDHEDPPRAILATAAEVEDLAQVGHHVAVLGYGVTELKGHAPLQGVAHLGRLRVAGHGAHTLTLVSDPALLCQGDGGSGLFACATAGEGPAAAAHPCALSRLVGIVPSEDGASMDARHCRVGETAAIRIDAQRAWIRATLLAHGRSAAEVKNL